MRWYRGSWASLSVYVVVLLIFIVVVALVPSIWLVGAKDDDTQGIFRIWERLQANFIPNLLTYGPVVFFTGAFSMAFYHFIMWKREFGQLLQPFRDHQVHWRLVWGILVCAALTLVVLVVTSSETKTDFVAKVVNNPGGWFAIATGIISVLGVYLTLLNVLEIRNSIVSFSDFVRRTEKLIEETDKDDCIRIMLHTPAPGCLVLPNEIWQKLTDRMKTCHKHISLTCLKRSDMERWFQEYLSGLRPDGQEKMRRRISAGLVESDAVKLAINAHVEQRQPDDSLDAGVVEAAWHDLPHCYYVANSSRAIVVAPFFLPRPGVNNHVGNARYRSVQMIGFETTDFHIVETVQKEIQIRRDAIREAQPGPETHVPMLQPAEA